jgi:hypothetical protein
MARARRKASVAAGAVAPASSVLAAPLPGFIGAGGRIAIAEVADSFGMSKSQLAETIGLGRETLYKAARAEAAKTQSRVREMLEIIGRISAWAGGKERTGDGLVPRPTDSGLWRQDRRIPRQIR